MTLSLLSLPSKTTSMSGQEEAKPLIATASLKG